ncbi:4-hydroxy-2-oxo-heptane-1,7-dioate aldolase [compost metagenome]
MTTPRLHNAFKQALAEGRPQIGLWLGLADSYAAEILGGVGYDWLLIDNEHVPNDLRSSLTQLQAIASAAQAIPGSVNSHAVVRLPVADTTLVKQYLDIGAQTLLLPMIDTVEQAREAVRSMRYPPEGIRGMGSGISRSSRWHRFGNYIKEANEQVCLLVQVETREAITNLDEIIATPGVDGVFIGPADLSASLGYAGHSDHPDVRAVIDQAIVRIRKAGKAAGILCANEVLARHYLDQGALFVAVGVDTSLLNSAAKTLLDKFKGSGPKIQTTDSGY